MQSGEGGPRAMQHISPLMIQFGDDEKGINERENLTGQNKNRKGTEKSLGGLWTERKRPTKLQTSQSWSDSAVLYIQ